MSFSIRTILLSLLFDSVGKYLEDNTSHADAVFWHLNGLEFDEFSIILMDFFDESLRLLRKLVSWNKITIAFDETFIPYYGRKTDSVWVHGYKNGVKGAVGSYKFMVASIVLANKRFNLFMIPMSVTDNSVALVDEILIKIKKYFLVSLVLLDRGFASKEATYNLEKADVKYIILCPKWKNVKKHLSNKELKVVEKTHYYKNKHRYDVDMKYVFAYKFFQHDWVFLTNTKYSTPLALMMHYKGRWSIETGFRMMDLADIKSKSTNMVIRAFLFTISIILHNEWLEYRETEQITFAKYLENIILANNDLIKLINKVKNAKEKFNIKLTNKEKKIMTLSSFNNLNDNNIKKRITHQKNSFNLIKKEYLEETNIQKQIIV